MPDQQSKPHPVGNKHIVNQGYDQEIANMRIALKKVETYAPFGQHETALRYLQEFAGYQDNALACRDCQATDMPLTLAEGGSSPEYQCPVCHAKQAIAWYDQEQQALTYDEAQAEQKAKPPTRKPPTRRVKHD